MKKLTTTEIRALQVLNRKGAICLSLSGDILMLTEVGRVLDSLVKKGRAVVEATDDGPRYELTAVGRAEAADAP